MNIFEEVSSLLGVDPESSGVRLAEEQIDQDLSWLDRLIAIRKEKFSDINLFADHIGEDVEKLSLFESDPLDAPLDFIRIYSWGIGVATKHSPEYWSCCSSSDGVKKRRSPGMTYIQLWLDKGSGVQYLETREVNHPGDGYYTPVGLTLAVETRESDMKSTYRKLAAHG